MSEEATTQMDTTEEIKGTEEIVKSNTETQIPSGPRFELKKWSAVAMWSWDICADTCAICRNSLNEPSIEYQVL